MDNNSNNASEEIQTNEIKDLLKDILKNSVNDVSADDFNPFLKSSNEASVNTQIMRNDFVKKFQQIVDSKVDQLWNDDNIDKSLSTLAALKSSGKQHENGIGWRPTGLSAHDQLRPVTSEFLGRKKLHLEEEIEKEMAEMNLLLEELDESRRNITSIEKERNMVWNDVKDTIDDYGDQIAGALEKKVAAFKLDL